MKSYNLGQLVAYIHRLYRCLRPDIYKCNRCSNFLYPDSETRMPSKI